VIVQTDPPRERVQAAALSGQVPFLRWYLRIQPNLLNGFVVFESLKVLKPKRH